jgi:hypothetical protein
MTPKVKFDASADRLDKKNDDAPPVIKAVKRSASRWSAFTQYLHLKIHLLWVLLLVWGSNFSSRRLFRKGCRNDAARDKTYHDGQHIQTTRKFVVVGDDFALGLGDWVTMGHTLPPGFLKGMRIPMLGQLIPWHFFIFAYQNTSTRDWLPTPEKLLDALAGQKHLPIFEAAFHPTVGLHRDADVVVLSLGCMDRLPAEEVAKHIVTICTALERRGKRVLVVPPLVPYFAKSHEDPEVAKRLVRRIEAIEKAIRGAWPEQGRADTAVWVGPRLDVVVSGPLAWRFGGRYPSGQGYRNWGRAYQDVVTNICRTVEAPIYRALQARRRTAGGDK